MKGFREFLRIFSLQPIQFIQTKRLCTLALFVFNGMLSC